MAHHSHRHITNLQHAAERDLEKRMDPTAIPAIPIGFNQNERGNTWLISNDGLSHYVLIRLSLIHVASPPKSERTYEWLQITLSPENYPGMTTSIIDATESQLAEYINNNRQGWDIRRCNIAGVKVDTIDGSTIWDGESEFRIIE